MSVYARALGDGVSAVTAALASDRGLRRACFAWIAIFVVLCALGVTMHQIGPRLGLDPAVVGFFVPTREWSLPSTFGYLTALAAAVGLLASHRRSGRFGYLAWALVVLAICLDDAFQYHETLGGLIAAALAIGPAYGMRGQDMGEVLAWAMLGPVVLPALVSALRTTDPAIQGAHAVFFVLFSLLLVFAVGMDLVHVLGPKALRPLLGLIEDSGEITVLGLMAAAAWAFHGRERGRRFPASTSPQAAVYPASVTLPSARAPMV